LRINIHKITAGPFQENGYIVHSERSSDCIIIDPGDSPELYIKEIENNNLKPIGILNTHGHIDHVHAVQPLKDHYSIPFYLHENDTMLLRDHYQEICLMYGMVPGKTPEVDVELNTEAEVLMGEYNIKIIHTPGHTPGGLCYQISGDIFTGDTLFKGSIGRTDLPGGDYNTLMDSLKLLIKSVPDDTKVHSGHGYSTTMKDEILSNPFLINI
jgi:hydroxyacylglutathione hydrolase